MSPRLRRHTGSGGRRPLPLARRRGVVTGAALAVLLVPGIACAGDDTDAASTSTNRPTTTAPPALEDQVQDLLRRFDEVTAEIRADPDRASDADDPLYADLRALMSPDSEAVGPMIDALVARAASGVALRPVGDHDLPIERRVAGPIAQVSADEWRVPVCDHANYGLFDGRDQQIRVFEDRAEPADATIVRVDGDLRIRRFDSVDDDARCGDGQP